MKTLHRRLIRILVSLNLFLLGAALMVLLYGVPAPPLGSAPPVVDTHAVTVRVQTMDDVPRVRAALHAYLFGGSPPTTASCEGNTCVVNMAHGVTSQISIRHPVTGNGQLAIYHNGHAGETPDATVTIDALLSAGYTVAVFDMPLHGVNPPVRASLPLYGDVLLTEHNHLQFLNGMVDGSPIRFLIEPVITYLNTAADDYERIIMLGISGGGWTTTWAAALDTRIDASYPIAGSLPIALRFVDYPYNWGDWEQHEPTLYALADYPDLYVLGAENRRQMQILNDHDACCFRGDYRALYEPQVADAAGRLGGSFQVYLDTENMTHTLSPHALALLLQDVA